MVRLTTEEHGQPDNDPRSCKEMLHDEEVSLERGWCEAWLLSYIPLIPLEGAPMTQEEFDWMHLNDPQWMAAMKRKPEPTPSTQTEPVGAGKEDES